MLAAAVLLKVTYVAPVVLHRIAVDRPARGQQLRPEFVSEVVDASFGNPVQDLGLKNVDAGVNAVGKDVAPVGFFNEALDPAPRVGHRDAILKARVYGLESHCRQRAASAV